jgi:hypothetical protein
MTARNQFSFQSLSYALGLALSLAGAGLACGSSPSPSGSDSRARRRRSPRQLRGAFSCTRHRRRRREDLGDGPRPGSVLRRRARPRCERRTERRGTVPSHLSYGGRNGCRYDCVRARRHPHDASEPAAGRLLRARHLGSEGERPLRSGFRSRAKACRPGSPLPGTSLPRRTISDWASHPATTPIFIRNRSPRVASICSPPRGS